MIKMKPITVCDKCSVEMDEPIVSFDSMDFCKGCYLELFGMISNWLTKEKEIEVPEIFPVISEETKEEIKQEISQKVSTSAQKGLNKDGTPKKVKISVCTRNKDKKGAQSVKPKRKPIDWDKACALKLAGRTNAWIADEIGCAVGTVNTEIYKKLDSYKARKKQEEEEAKRAILNV